MQTGRLKMMIRASFAVLHPCWSLVWQEPHLGTAAQNALFCGKGLLSEKQNGSLLK